MTRPRFWIALLLAGVCSVGACQLLSGEVACDRDQDCPTDAGISFCTAWTNRGDGGAGVCTDDEAFEGDFKFDAGPDAGLSPGDAGVADGANGVPGA